MIYDHTNSEFRIIILTLYEEGYTFEDFKRVIDYQVIEYTGNKQIENYLRPTRLFGTKFKDC